jgi:hypothetical protein
MKSMHQRQAKWLGILGAGALGAGACATRGPAGGDEDTATPVALILATPRYELHLRAGRMYELLPGANPEDAPTLRPIDRAGDFRMLYERSTGQALPASGPDGSIVVNGWANLECVRAAHACGIQPEAAPHAPIRVYFGF